MKFSLFILAIATFSACSQEPTISSDTPKETTPKIKELVEDVLTKKQQDALTPDMVLEMLEGGNIFFMNNDLTARNHSAQVRKSTLAQYPKAIVMSCVDSRVPVEDVFNRGIGDLFVARVAGNFVNEDILGSMEFACKVSGSKLILVMGHEHCGAIKAAIDDVKLGNITSVLQKIRPVVDVVEYEGERNSKNQEFVHLVSISNVKNTMEQIRLKSPILKEMEDNGEIKIIGALYDMDNGVVDFIE
ncbi:MAG: carbonic anhydrase [Saprospiraceae bacterium]|jgi:carbonic anhydrase